MAEETKYNPWLPLDVIKWQRTTPPDTPWLMRGLTPAASIVWVSGPPKKGFKTWWAFVHAQALASGISYGEFIKPVERMPVLFIEREGTTPGNMSRMRKVQLGCFNVDPLKADPYDGNLGWMDKLRLKLDNPGHVKKLVELIKEHGYKLVILDAVTLMHGGDENSKQDMQRVVDAAIQIKEAGATVMGLCHVNKESRKIEHDIDLDLRGSSVMIDCYDAHMALRRDKETDQLWMKVRYREHRERVFNLWWEVDECPEAQFEAHDIGRLGGNKACQQRRCNHYCALLKCNHKAKLIMKKYGARENQEALFKQKVAPKFQRGVVYTHNELRLALGKGFTASRVSELRSKWLEQGLIEIPPNGKGFIIPNGGDK